MNNYELVAKVSKYAAVVGTVYLLGKFGFTIRFDKHVD